MITYADEFRYGLFAAEGTLKVDGDWKGGHGLSKFKRGDRVGVHVDMSRRTLQFSLSRWVTEGTSEAGAAAGASETGAAAGGAAGGAAVGGPSGTGAPAAPAGAQGGRRCDTKKLERIAQCRLPLCSRMLTYAHVCSRMLTHAHSCSRMLTYAHVFSRMLTYAHVCRWETKMLERIVEGLPSLVHFAVGGAAGGDLRSSRMLTYAHLCSRILTQQAATSGLHVSSRMVTYAYVCSRSRRRRQVRCIPTYVCSRMLTYAHVCSRMLTYAHVCLRMLTYSYAC
jgi:hypothetical protein